MTRKRLEVKLESEPDSFQSQETAKQAVMVGSNFAVTYLLARVRMDHPYENYVLPDNIAEFEFSAKGALRLELMGDPAFRGYRRLLGSMFTRRRSGERYSWRSRVLMRAFPGLGELLAFLARDPLRTWPDVKLTPVKELARSLSASRPGGGEEWVVLLQVIDVELPDGTRLADVLENFLDQHSALFSLMAREDVLPPA